MPSFIITIEGKEYQLDDISFEVLDAHLVDWHVGGITDPLGQLISWLWDQISSAFSTLENTVWGFLRTIRDNITSAVSGFINSAVNTLSSAISGVESLVSSVISSINSLSSTVSSMISGLTSIVSSGIASLSSAISSAVSSVASAISNVASAVSSMINALSSQVSAGFSSLASAISSGFSSVISSLSNIASAIISAITNAISTVQSVIQNMVSSLLSAFQGISAFLSSVFSSIMNAISGVATQIWGFISGLISSIKGFFEQLYGYFAKSFSNIASFFSNAVQQLQGFIAGAVDAFQKGFQQTMDFFAGAFKKLQEGMQNVQLVLAGFVNPLAQIQAIFQQMWDMLKVFSWDNITKFFTKDIPSALWDFFMLQLKPALGEVFNIIFSFIKTHVIEPVSSFVKGIIEGIRKQTEKLADSIIAGVMGIAKSARDWFSLGTPPEDPTPLIRSMLLSAVEYVSSGALLAGMLDYFATEIQLMGNKVKLEDRALARVLTDIFRPSTFMTPFMWAYMYAVAFPSFDLWFKYWYRPQLPTPLMAIEWYWTSREEADDTRETVKKILQHLGYHDSYIDWFFKSSVAQLTVADIENIYYRLKYYGKLSDMRIRMALPEREIEISLGDFKQLIKSLQDKAGIENPDEFFLNEMWRRHYTSGLAHAQLLADMKIPSVSDLITFVVREVISPEDFFVACQMQNLPAYWASAYWEAHWRLPSFESLREAFWRGIISADEFKKYVIWHDYRPFARKGISKSDVDIMMSLQWKLPTRIDTRWMAKYGLLSFDQHKRLVQMEGYPDGDPYELGFNIAETVAKAEIINVVVDERTLWRNRLFDSYELGLITEQELNDIFSKGFSTTIDGVEFKVGFHPLEVRLMLESARRERANKLAEDTIDELIDAYVYGAISFNDFKRRLRQYVKDEEVAKAIESKVALRRLRHVVSSVRSEAESAIDRWLYLYESGYATLEEIKREINKLTPKAGISNEELEVIFSQAEARRERWVRDKTYDHIRRLYQYGRISRREYEELMQKLGFPESIRKLELEAQSWFITRYDDIAERAVDLYIEGKADWGTIEDILKEIGMNQDWIEQRRRLAEVERKIYQLGSSK